LFAKKSLAGIGGVAKQVPEGYRPKGKPRKARTKRNWNEAEKAPGKKLNTLQRIK
jgi:hypothetical protein